MCALLGLPGKLGVDGSMVEGMHEEGRIEEIRDYCELDVLNTYLVYLRYMLMTGSMSGDGHDGALQEVKLYLDRESSARAHLVEFAEAWG